MNEYDIDGDTVDPERPIEAHYTPNVAIEKPRYRKIINAVLNVLAIVIAVAMAVDGASEDIDWSAWTFPAVAGIGALASYGLIVTQPNIPKR